MREPKPMRMAVIKRTDELRKKNNITEEELKIVNSNNPIIVFQNK